MSNASLTLGPNSSIKVSLWLQSFAMSIDQEQYSAQLRLGKAIQPTRLTNETVHFSVVYSVQNYKLMERLCDQIAMNSVASLESPALVTLHYHAIKRSWQGIISRVSKGDERFQTSYIRQFSLQVLRNLQSGSKISGGSGNIVYPTSSAPTTMGSDWYSAKNWETGRSPWEDVNSFTEQGFMGMRGRPTLHSNSNYMGDRGTPTLRG